MKKKNILLSIFGLALFVVFIIIFAHLNFGEFKSVNDMAVNFLELLFHGEYLEASRFVDNTRIEIEELEKVSTLASNYNLGSTYFGQISKNIYEAGFKPNNIDNNRMNDNALKFQIAKVKTEWKVITIFSR